MKTMHWFHLLSGRQKRVLGFTLVLGVLVVAVGFIMHAKSNGLKATDFIMDMSIQQIAPELGVTGMALAREFNLPPAVSKKKPIRELDVTTDVFDEAIHHLLSHIGAAEKYYVFFVLSMFGLVYLSKLGRPDTSGIKERNRWYPRLPYITSLIISVLIGGFLLGKSPNPMEGVVKVFKSLAASSPDINVKLLLFCFFILLAIAGNKLICGWACPFGALQELIYSIPLLKKIKKKKVPFVFTNTIRACLFAATLLLLFGIIGNRKGFVIYHYLNPFNLFHLHFETISILMTVVIVCVLSFALYRPFCQLICPFGFVSWIVEKFSIYRVKIDPEKCTECGACITACPTAAAKGYVDGKTIPADCFSCARCLNVCPVDAIQYTSIFKKSLH